MLAIPWYYTSILNKPSEFGFLYFVVTAVSLFWGLYAGTLIDRYDRKKLFLFLSIGGGLLMFVFSYVGFQYGYVPNILVALAFAMTIFVFNIHFPNLYAFLQEITLPKDYGRITSLIEVSHQTTTALSGAMAAILISGSIDGKLNLMGVTVAFPFEIERWEMQEIFLMDAISYILAVILILFIRYVPIAERKPEGGNVVTRLKKGFSYLRNNPMIFVFGNASYGIFVTILVSGFFLLPVYVNKHLGASGDVFASGDVYFALGSVLAGIGVIWLFKRYNNVFAVIVTCLLTTTIYLLNIVNTSVLIFFFLLLLLGFCNAGTRVLRITWLFQHVQNSVIGRTSSAFNLLNVIIRSGFIGLFSIPFFMEGNHVVRAYGGLACFTLLSALVLAVFYRRILSKPMTQEEGTAK